MERVLTQEEIDAMVRMASGRKDDRQRKETRSIKLCTFRQSGQLTSEQVAAVNGLHEGFARTLTQSLGAYLRVSFEVTLVSIEQLAYSEFLERIPEITYMMCFQVEQMSAGAAMQIDHSLVFPLIDILLGGSGHCDVFTREVSEIEEQIMEGVAKIICRELEATWAVMGTKLDLDGRQPPAQMQRFLAPTEKTLCLSFEVKVAEATGTLNLIFPVSISNTLLRKLSVDWSYGKSRPATRNGEQMTARMLECLFPIELGITAIKLPINVLAALVPQQVRDLGVPVLKPASLIIAGREAFEANPVRQGRLRAAQVGRPLAFAEEERKP
jgi:flagellar motor switch protein FliM